METTELLSGHLAWWLAGGALVILLLLAPRLRRPRDDGAREDSLDPVSPHSGVDAQGGGPAIDVVPAAPSETDGDGCAAAAVDSGASAADDGDVEMNNAMRLEVARVYMELQDAEGAEAMLRQVVEDGDENERQAAEAMRRAMADGHGGGSAGDDGGPARDAENLLDLATAYVEIGDAELARRTVAQIEEVGSEAQCRQARALLERLPD